MLEVEDRPSTAARARFPASRMAVEISMAVEASAATTGVRLTTMATLWRFGLSFPVSVDLH